MDTALAADAVRPTGVHRRRGALTPGELAEAAVLGDIALVFEALGWFLPFGGALQVFGVVPIALLASRHRARAAVVATCAVGAAGFVIGGIGLVLQAWLFGSLGLSVGVARRRSKGPLTAVALGIVITALPAALGSVALSAIFPSLRKLLLAQVDLYGRGVARFLTAVGARRAGNDLVNWLTWVNNHWWLTYPAVEIVAISVIVGLAARYLAPLLDRLQREAVAPRTGLVSGVAEGAEAAPGGTGRGERVGPVPVELRDVSFRYPGAAGDAVANVSLVVAAGDLTVLVGPNGSGKSTLARLLAGRAPTAGEVVRPGDPGLGRTGGTAMVFQRPESQVLGVRVRDDVVWGLPTGVGCDIAGLLARVGLEGMGDRETSTLSGGELQRLAIAAALARSPSLVISDESTSMLDSDGQEAVVALLGELAGAGVAVVHVTHRTLDGARATRVVRLGGEARTASPDDGWRTVTVRQSADPPLVPAEAADVRLRGVGHVYARGTPWAHRALEGIDLEVVGGQGVVVAGANGSGKSTLAWVLAGLVVPSEGEALVGGAAAADRTGSVGLGFQHARLQLLRPTVLADVAYGSDPERAAAALAAVGLDSETVGDRRVDELSGGEQRRVALAGLLARSPRLVVLDEPLAGLDEDTRTMLERVLARLRREEGVATIVVAHDLAMATGLGDRLVTLAGGRVVADQPMPRHAQQGTGG